jgi:glycine reductase
MEKAGLPTVVVTAMSPLAQSVGANRIVRGKAISHPFGDPTLIPEEERQYRKRLVEEALVALGTSVEAPTVFEPKE